MKKVIGVELILPVTIEWDQESTDGDVQLLATALDFRMHGYAELTGNASNRTWTMEAWVNEEAEPFLSKEVTRRKTNELAYLVDQFETAVHQELRARSLAMRVQARAAIRPKAVTKL